MFLRPCDVKIQSMIDKDYAERVSVDELFLDDGSVCYIHHHPVLSKPGMWYYELCVTLLFMIIYLLIITISIIYHMYSIFI